MKLQSKYHIKACVFNKHHLLCDIIKRDIKRKISIQIFKKNIKIIVCGDYIIPPFGIKINITFNFSVNICQVGFVTIKQKNRRIISGFFPYDAPVLFFLQMCRKPLTILYPFWYNITCKEILC